MALVVADRVKETTTSTGTGAISLGGAEPNFRTFSSVLSDADTTYYAIIDDTNLAFEVGLGTYASSGNTITRTTVLASSNSNNAVNFSAGTKDVFLTYPADKSVNRDASGNVSIPAQGDLRLEDASGGQYVALQAPATVGSSFTFTLPSADGSASQLLQTDGSGNLSFTTVNASPSFTATASGALANGDKVILNSNGTVSVIDGVTGSVGSATTFTSSGNILYLATTFDSSNNRIVLAYRDQADSNKGKAVVGTISGTSISFGSAVVFNATNGSTSQIAATFDSNSNKVVLAYAEGSVGNKGTAVVGTVSGTSISFGTAVEFKNAEISETGIAFDSSNNKVVIAYKDHGNSDYGTAIVGTVSGTDISFGTAVVYESANSLRNRVVFDSSNNKIVIGYRDGGNSSYGTAIVGTVSGTSISFGSAAVFESGASIDDLSGVFDTTNNKVVFAYRDEGTSPQYNGNAVVGTVSGTSISFGTPVEFHAGSGGSIQATSTAFSPDAEKVLIAYSSDTNQDVFSIAGTVSGTSITFDSATTITATATAYSPEVVVAYDTNANAFGICYDLSGIRAEGKVNTVTYTNLTSSNFIGISDAAYSDGATATIQIVGAVDDAQSSLAIGSDYYVQTDGTLNTTKGTPTVYAGKAITATKLAIQYPELPSNSLTLISSVTDVSDSSTIDLTGMSDSFGAYKVYISDIIPVSQNNLLLQIFDDGTIQTSSNLYHWRTGILQGSSVNVYNDNSDSHIEMVTSSTPAGPFTGEITISRSKVSNHVFNYSLAAGAGKTGNDARLFMGSGIFYTTDPTHGTERFDMTGIRIKFSSGNLSARHVALYGVS